MIAFILVARAVLSFGSTCEPFVSSLNGTHNCPTMQRERSADGTSLACKKWCCSQGRNCNAFLYHVGASQCLVSASLVDPQSCSSGSMTSWVGETRHVPPPTPPPPKKHSWNLEPGLLPPNGIWRGATVDNRFGNSKDDQVSAFQTAYNTRLHIYRSFKTPTWTSITSGEMEFIASGGILFYSIEPQNWTAWVDWQAAWKIKKFAAAIKAVAPAQVMIAPGYEPDGHAAESQNKTNQVYGKAAEYKAMFRNFRKVFAQENVTNAVFVLDLSCAVRDWEFVLPQLYPGDDVVDWAFFNLFQSQKQAKKPKPPKHTQGNCTTMFDQLYAVLNNGVIKNSTIPFGVGAWGTMNQTFGDPKDGYPSEAIPAADRELCINQVASALSDTQKYARIKASIYFNSLNSLISPNPETPFPSSELAPTFQKMLDLPIFTVNDATSS